MVIRLFVTLATLAAERSSLGRVLTRIGGILIRVTRGRDLVVGKLINL